VSFDRLDIAMLDRLASRDGGKTVSGKTERHTVDFLVNEFNDGWTKAD
jgi:hypothetical protein